MRISKVFSRVFDLFAMELLYISTKLIMIRYSRANVPTMLEFT